jgi:hypothetical protein
MTGTRRRARVVTPRPRLRGPSCRTKDLSGQVDVDGVAYQLVTIELDGGFAAAADLGPIVLAAQAAT